MKSEYERIIMIFRFARAIFQGLLMRDFLAPFTHDWEKGVPTADDVSFSEEIWSKK